METCLEALWAVAIWVGLFGGLDHVDDAHRREIVACTIVNTCGPDGNLNRCNLRRRKP